MINSFNVVKEIVGYADERFAPFWSIDDEKFNILGSYCRAIDKVLDEFGGKSLQVDVDETYMTVSITIEIAEAVIRTNKHNLYELISRTESFSFSKTEDGDGVYVEMVFPKIWDRAV